MTPSVHIIPDMSSQSSVFRPAASIRVLYSGTVPAVPEPRASTPNVKVLLPLPTSSENGDSDPCVVLRS